MKFRKEIGIPLFRQELSWRSIRIGLLRVEPNFAGAVRKIPDLYLVSSSADIPFVTGSVLNIVGHRYSNEFRNTPEAQAIRASFPAGHVRQTAIVRKAGDNWNAMSVSAKAVSFYFLSFCLRVGRTLIIPLTALRRSIHEAFVRLARKEEPLIKIDIDSKHLFIVLLKSFVDPFDPVLLLVRGPPSFLCNTDFRFF
jgi:hypothetical protein